MLFVIQKKDEKSLEWASAATENSMEILPQPDSPIMAPFFLVKIMFLRGRPAGYIVRYLNDYTSFPKTLIRLISELLVVFMCKLFRIKIFWICHNVDKESSENYPKIQKIRRRVFANQAKKIFVLDFLLIPYARKYFPGNDYKIGAISFGRINARDSVRGQHEQIAVDFISRKRDEAKSEVMKHLVVFCVGAPAEKSLHFDYLETLITEGRLSGYLITAIVAGAFRETTRGKLLLEKYRNDQNICVFGDVTRFTNDFVKLYVDFYWRGYSDWSVPYTVYEAATLGKPTLALKTGFLPELVREHMLGCTVDLSFVGLPDCLRGLSENRFDFEGFLQTHKWDSLSQRLMNV